MRSKVVKVALVGAAIVLTGAVIWVVSSLKANDSLGLMSCVESERAPVAWVCRQGLYGLHPSQEEVRLLTSQAATVHAASMKNEEEARRLVRHFVRAGVDINAPSEQSAMKWTALHSAAMDPNARAVRLLLELGARPDVRDAKNRTPADLARLMSEKYKGEEARYAEVVRLLEGVQTSAK
jgi:ankyrin repeat protein